MPLQHSPPLLFDDYYGPGNPAAITAVEQALAIHFPPAYTEIVSRHNGAFIVNRPFFRYFSQLHAEEVESGTGMFLAFGEVPGCTETMEIKLRLPPDQFPTGLVIFSALGNGDALCFDYRNSTLLPTPPVVVWHHEAAPGSREEISSVAASFPAFLELLYEDDFE